MTFVAPSLQEILQVATVFGFGDGQFLVISLPLFGGKAMRSASKAAS
jgi:hypothetical protein